MADNKNPNEPQQLNDDDLSQVNGGYFSGDTATWDEGAEKALQADFAAHGNGMSFDAFLSSKGLPEVEIMARNSWIRSGSRSDSTVVASPGAQGGWNVQNFVIP